MNFDILNALSANVTIISSVVAIASVTICAIAVALINQHGIRKAKHSELLFQEKCQAYYDYLLVSSHYDNLLDSKLSREYSDATARALLFASEHTQDMIAKHGKKMYAYLKLLGRTAANGEEDNKLTEKQVSAAIELSDAKANLIKAMQNDLQWGRHIMRHKH